MADFVQSSETKSAIRTLASQIADVATFNSIVQSVITDNPFACISYMTAGVTHDPVEKTRESYTVKLIYQDTEAKTIGSLSDKYSTIAGFNASATALLASAPVTAAHGGTAVRDADNETYSAILRCPDANGELFMVNLSRERVSLTSYADEAIRTKVETWTDTVAARVRYFYKSCLSGSLHSVKPTSLSETPERLSVPALKKVSNSRKMEQYLFRKLQYAPRSAGFGINQALKRAQLGSIGGRIACLMG